MVPRREGTLFANSGAGGATHSEANAVLPPTVTSGAPPAPPPPRGAAPDGVPAKGGGDVTESRPGGTDVTEDASRSGGCAKAGMVAWRCTCVRTTTLHNRAVVPRRARI